MIKPLTRPMLLSLTVAAIAVAGCTSSPVKNAEPLPELTFAHLQTLPVQVSRIEFIPETQRGATMWDSGNDLPTPADTAMTRYIAKRFKASGVDGVLRIHLKKAQITAQEMPNANKILSYIPLADTDEYTYEILVDIENMYMAGRPNVRSTKRFVRKIQMPINVTMAYREAKLQRTLEEMMRDIDTSLVQTMAYNLQVIDGKDIPSSKMKVETQLPAKETRIGATWDKVTDEVDAVVDKAVERTKGTFGESENSAPRTITPQPVTAEPLNK